MNKGENMDNNNGLIIGGLFAIVCLIMFALMQRNTNQQQTVTPPVVVQPAPAQPQQPQIQHQHHCPPDILGASRELYSMGYMDASSGRRPNSIYRNDPYYMRGYRDGAPHCPPQLRFNINID